MATSEAASAVSRKYWRQHALPSPLSDHVKWRLLSNIYFSGASTDEPQGDQGRPLSLLKVNTRTVKLVLMSPLKACAHGLRNSTMTIYYF